MENTLIYDWLSFTSKTMTKEEMIELLGLSSMPWQQIKGAHGYRWRLYYSSISVFFNLDEGEENGNSGTWCEMSGQGCRAFETYSTHKDYNVIFDLIRSAPNDMHLTRLDVAYDDKKGILDIDTICDDIRQGNYVSKASCWEVIFSSGGNSTLIGSKTSEVIIRIYDKARERGFTDGTKWIRVELQMRRDRAYEYINLPYPPGTAFSGVLINYLRFVEPDESDSNKSRWALRDYWANLLEDCTALSIYKKVGVNYNLLNLENYVVNQCGNAISALFDYYGYEETIKKIKERKTRPNPKYTRAVEEARKEMKK